MGHTISVDQDRHVTSAVAKYLENVTIIENWKFHTTILPHDMIFTKKEYFTSGEQAKLFSRGYNIDYKASVGSFVHLLSTWVDLCFVLRKLVNVSSNNG